MTCSFDDKILHLYVDGELSAGTEIRVTEHLRFCDDCSARVKEIESLKNELSKACSTVRAPQYLRSRIIEKISQEQSSKEIKFAFMDNIRLFFQDIKPAQAIIPGLVFAFVLLLVFVPNRSGLNTMADILVQQHLHHNNLGVEGELQTDVSSEVNAFLGSYLGQRINVPDCLGKDVYLKGCCLLKVQDIQVAQVGYASGSTKCSLFIINSPILEDCRADYLMASGIKFRYGSIKNVNYICWQEGSDTLVIISCCPHDKLINMAVSAV
jgi:anti-sigma factor RsiW